MPTDKVVDCPRRTSSLYPQLAPRQLVEFDPLPRFDPKVRRDTDFAFTPALFARGSLPAERISADTQASGVPAEPHVTEDR